MHLITYVYILAVMNTAMKLLSCSMYIPHTISLFLFSSLHRSLYHSLSFPSPSFSLSSIIDLPLCLALALSYSLIHSISSTFFFPHSSSPFSPNHSLYHHPLYPFSLPLHLSLYIYPSLSPLPPLPSFTITPLFLTHFLTPFLISTTTNHSVWKRSTSSSNGKVIN